MFISDNTKVILLLTAPLLLGKSQNNIKLLSNKEYHQLAVYLKNHHKQPADLLGNELSDILADYGKLEYERIQQLLQRGFLLSQTLDYWHSRNIWVISRADKTYPSRLKIRLGEQAPPILYGCGDVNLLNFGGIAIVGSRNIDDELITYTQNIAHLAAQSGKMVVSGGAKGVDLAAMQEALQVGGVVCGVLADSLEKMALNAVNRSALQENRLVLISACDPKSRFMVGNAMQRNKYIYALSDIGLVVNSDLNKGGTWAGAVEQLDKYKHIPIYVRSTGTENAGLNALVNKGALWWDNPRDTQSFLDIFNGKFVSNMNTPKPQTNSSPNDKSITHPNLDLSPEKELFLLVKKLIEQNLQEPKKEKELAELLAVSSSQIRIWLERLIKEDVVVKQNKPIRYALRSKSENLELFPS
ncbi:DNA-processing protein DprA [Moraxella sp. ZY210820]|uniref:DNA-processing protein DprA n=1 Tax=unclassified Moraxella TaxID=2685852 RepID=UPI00272F325D|nr:DNA-processing protein DprA [Moraxella sp. ZY210820]WLF83367.1 DNA-processing protein DprA [Moraxella sp. ZY210820]